jgi:anion-transporting  ArsA/GET3 family ATPase
MASLLERKLIVVTGKGGAGKSTIAAALGLVAARQGLRTLVVEVGERDHLAALYGRAASLGEGEGDKRPIEEGSSQEHGDDPRGGAGPDGEVELEPGLWSLSLDPDSALIEWVRDLGGRLSARVLASSSSFQYFAAAAPGAKELVSLVKLHELCAGGGGGRHDLVVLDAPATGHALAMLAAPDTFTAIVPGGPLARRADQVREMLADPRISGYVAVAAATELAVSETLELERGLRERLGRDLDAVVVNGTIARRFTLAELARLDALANDLAASGKGDRLAGSVAVAAARAARAAGERARAQRRQIARLRRLRLHDAPAGRRFGNAPAPSIVSVPFAFVPGIDRAALAKIAGRLERQLIPSRSSRPSSARQSRRTRTDRSR